MILYLLKKDVKLRNEVCKFLDLAVHDPKIQT